MFAIDHHERRTVHLGVDLFAPPYSPIYAPLAGTIHSLANHREEQDYGPALILKHEPTAEICFFTLYGHLSPETLDRWQVGQPVDAGALLAYVGDYPDNGNWAPHLHIQIISDMLDNGDNFPRRLLAKLTRPLDIAFARSQSHLAPALRFGAAYEAESRRANDTAARSTQSHPQPLLSAAAENPARVSASSLR